MCGSSRLLSLFFILFFAFPRLASAELETPLSPIASKVLFQVLNKNPKLFPEASNLTNENAFFKTTDDLNSVFCTFLENPKKLVCNAARIDSDNKTSGLFFSNLPTLEFTLFLQNETLSPWSPKFNPNAMELRGSFSDRLFLALDRYFQFNPKHPLMYYSVYCDIGDMDHCSESIQINSIESEDFGRSEIKASLFCFRKTEFVDDYRKWVRALNEDFDPLTHTFHHKENIESELREKNRTVTETVCIADTN